MSPRPQPGGKNLPLALPRPDWFDQAACLGAGPSLWFPEQGEDGVGRAVSNAAEVCHTCPVRAACLEHALETHEQHGYWGGLSPKARQKTGRRILAQLREGQAA